MSCRQEKEELLVELSIARADAFEAKDDLESYKSALRQQAKSKSVAAGHTRRGSSTGDGGTGTGASSSGRSLFDFLDRRDRQDDS